VQCERGGESRELLGLALLHLSKRLMLAWRTQVASQKHSQERLGAGLEFWATRRWARGMAAFKVCLGMRHFIGGSSLLQLSPCYVEQELRRHRQRRMTREAMSDAVSSARLLRAAVWLWEGNTTCSWILHTRLRIAAAHWREERLGGSLNRWRARARAAGLRRGARAVGYDRKGGRERREAIDKRE
jgi:hypothetical protein